MIQTAEFGPCVASGTILIGALERRLRFTLLASVKTALPRGSVSAEYFDRTRAEQHGEADPKETGDVPDRPAANRRSEDLQVG